MLINDCITLRGRTDKRTHSCVLGICEINLDIGLKYLTPNGVDIFNLESDLILDSMPRYLDQMFIFTILFGSLLNQS